MIKLLKRVFSPEKKAVRLERKLQKAVATDSQPEILTRVSRLLTHLLHEKQAQRLSDLIHAYAPKIEDFAAFDRHLSLGQLRAAVELLHQHEFHAAALLICERAGYDDQAIAILAKRGRARDLAMWTTKDGLVDKAFLERTVELWETYQGDVGANLTMTGMLLNVARSAPESIPDHPRVREVVGQFEEAATLYIQAGDLHRAARCYAQVERYEEACGLYEEVGENERASQMAESSGDLEKALDLVVNPDRKLRLLVRTERFRAAWDYAAGLESPDEVLDWIRQEARQCVAAKIERHEFVTAMDLADVAECDLAEREEILLCGRRYFDKQVATAASEEALKRIYGHRVALEERAGNFEEAGRLAEEVLEDAIRASFLYEKANLFDHALEAASGHKTRLAELHEKGGNLLKAAQLYESAGCYEQASALYERTQRWGKAVACYLKTDDPEKDVLIQLYRKAGEFEKAVDVYLEAGTFSDLQKALMMARAHNLATHVKVLEGRIAEFTSGSEQDLQRMYATARDDVRDTYCRTIGIDFGTTNSVVAVFNKRAKRVETVLTPGGSAYIPTFFGLDEDHHPIFGERAREVALTAPDRVVARVKRSLGKQKRFSIGGRHYRAEMIVANILQYLTSEAEAYIQSKVEARFYELLSESDVRVTVDMVGAFLSVQTDDHDLEDVVLSVPAYFTDNQKRATRDSAEIAGLRVRRLLHEPSAAALAYTHHRPYSGKLAVIDLGGGTLDISIVDIGEGINEVRSISGDTELGGSDIDALLVERAIEDIRERWGIVVDPATHATEIARLRHACESLKIDLSSVTQATMTLPHFLNRPSYTWTLTRAELESLSEPILARIQSTIADSLKADGSRIDNYILVGNAAKMPAVRDLVRDVIPARELTGINPGTLVATGAALQGSIMTGDLAELLLLDAVPYSLGIAAIEGPGDKEVISRLIDRNATIPAKKSGIYTTKVDNQPNVHVRVYQGESAEPHKNYFLGDFILEIPPAPAHTPQIEVTFDIGSDCILTVTAVDQATGNARSVRVEGTVVLTPEEKQTLRDYFAGRQRVHALEKALVRVRRDIESWNRSCDEAIARAEQAIKDFFELFHERVEANPQLYRADLGQVEKIQDMFLRKARFAHGVPHYRDQVASIRSSLWRIERPHLDFTAVDITAKLRRRIGDLMHYRWSLENTAKSVEHDVTSLVSDWTQVLRAMTPNMAHMDAVEVARYHLNDGRVDTARERLESLTSTEGLTEEAFRLLLRCYVLLGLKEAHRDAHRRFGCLFDGVYPDFSHLNAYLKTIADSVFMIHGAFDRHNARSGSGFSIAPHLIVTNRHVVESLHRQQITVVGKDATYRVEQLELDPINDLAVLHVNQTLRPLELGAFDFVEPGEQVLAIGFPTPDSDVHSENLYISKGIVNSIRTIETCSERVIFIDNKIGSGMSGGPLINDLGEVVGVVTLSRYGARPSPRGGVLVESQPIALPIDLVRRYVTITP